MLQNHITPFGTAVWLWRRARGLTQAELARRAGLPRPNLSAVERGHREVTLGTVRALAAGLGISPGMLVDGVSPRAGQAARLWGRAALERVAASVAGHRPLRHPAEAELAQTMRRLVANRARADDRRRGRVRTSARAMDEAWLQMGAGGLRRVAWSVAERARERRHRGT